MIRLTKKTDYGIVLLGQMINAEQGRVHNARDLAGLTGLPLPMVGKILKALVRGGLLVSHRGTKGGYRLARPAALIRVSDIIRALEGPIAITECISTEGELQCCVQRPCPVRISWARINEAINDALDAVTLADMVQPGHGACPTDLFRPIHAPRATSAPDPSDQRDSILTHRGVDR